jgi:hypothetical protein
LFIRNPLGLVVILAAILPNLTFAASSSEAEYAQALQSELRHHAEVRPALAAKVILVESHGHLDTPDGRMGEIGAMQIRPQTFAWVSHTILHKEDGALNARRPEDNLAVGVALLQWLLARYDHDETLALIGYNAGMGTADRAQHEIAEGREPHIPASTRAYIRNILGPSKPTVGPQVLLELAGQPSEIESVPNIVLATSTCSLSSLSFECRPETEPLGASNFAVLALVSSRRRLLGIAQNPAEDTLGNTNDPGRDAPRPPLLL